MSDDVMSLCTSVHNCAGIFKRNQYQRAIIIIIKADQGSK